VKTKFFLPFFVSIFLLTPIFLIIDLYSIDILRNDFSSLSSVASDVLSKTEETKVKNSNEIVIDTTSKVILMFGDSMVDGVRDAFKKYCKFNNHKFYYYTWNSSTTSAWANSNKLKTLIEKYKPDFVFIMLGSNELFSTDLAKREKYINDIISQLNDIEYVWIGPPNWKEDNGLNSTIEKVTGENRFFPSKNIFLVPPLKYKRSGDRKHPNSDAYKAWTDSIANWVMTNGKYPIKLEKPIE